LCCVLPLSLAFFLADALLLNLTNAALLLLFRIAAGLLYCVLAFLTLLLSDILSTDFLALLLLTGLHVAVVAVNIQPALVQPALVVGRKKVHTSSFQFIKLL
jgi:hypothetical protein